MACEREETVCECCGGSGVIHESLNDDGDMESTEECQCCGGSGYK